MIGDTPSASERRLHRWRLRVLVNKVAAITHQVPAWLRNGSIWARKPRGGWVPRRTGAKHSLRS